MSELVTLVMEPRDKTGKNENGRLRRAGYVPCILYGPEIKENIQGKVSMREIERIASKRWETLRLTVKLPSGEEEMCLIRELQKHPISDMPLHVDFLRLVKGRKITVKIPVEAAGRDAAPGVKDGGVLEVIHELVSALHVGESIHVKDLKLPENVEVLADPEEIVAIVATSRGVEEAAPEEAEQSAADVEVVAKGKAAKEEE